MYEAGQLKYRSEIDGLRAVAVLPVILFHAGFETFRGGFVGVDIFFVISGFLITAILVEELADDRFSLTGFYERRARRILPALFVVMLVCIPLAWMWMLPRQIEEFSNSLLATALFASNILFWRESGYFAGVSDEKPMLHTWSLAVEEQYYLLFPIFLFLAWRFRRNHVFWLVLACALLSLAIGEWGWRHKPTANFYLLPGRAWELLAGSLAALAAHRRPVAGNDGLALAGLALILFAIFVFDESVPFPSLYALVPVLGAVLILLFARNGTLAARLLSNPLFVGVGLVSYSAYLWHQPLLAFARIYTFGQFDEGVRALTLAATAGLAWLSWRFVETPFRNRSHFSRRFVFASSAAGLLAFGLVGISGNLASDRVLARSGDGAELIAQGLDDWAHPGDLRATKFPDLYVTDPDRPIDILFFGDSHSAQYAPLGRTIAENHSVNVGYLTGNNCAPIPDLDEASHPWCRGRFDRLQTVIDENPGLSKVVIGACFNCYFIAQSFPGYNFKQFRFFYMDGDRPLYFRESQGQDEALEAFYGFVQRLAETVDVTVILDNPLSDSFDPEVMLMRGFRGDVPQFRRKFRNFTRASFDIPERQAALGARIRARLEALNCTSILAARDLVCPDGHCSGRDPEGRPIYRDSNHMRPFYVVETFAKPVEELLFP